MPKTKEQYKAMRNATKEKIHSAAVELFTKKGFAATCVQDIADNAGISIGLIYRHYKTKDDLFAALILEAINGLKEFSTMLQSIESPIDSIKKFTSETLEDISKNNEVAQFITLVVQAFMMEEFVPQVHDLIEQDYKLIKETSALIERGQKLGQFKQGNPLEMALYYFSSIQGLAEMKFALKERFIKPNPKIVTAFLIKEESLDYAN